MKLTVVIEVDDVDPTVTDPHTIAEAFGLEHEYPIGYEAEGTEFDAMMVSAEWGEPAHALAESRGLTRERLKAALDSNDNWGSMVHAFEYLTAAGSVLETWPEED